MSYKSEINSLPDRIGIAKEISSLPDAIMPEWVNDNTTHSNNQCQYGTVKDLGGLRRRRRIW